jgi:hypothetical protein
MIKDIQRVRCVSFDDGDVVISLAGEPGRSSPNELMLTNHFRDARGVIVQMEIGKHLASKVAGGVRLIFPDPGAVTKLIELLDNLHSFMVAESEVN